MIVPRALSRRPPSRLTSESLLLGGATLYVAVFCLLPLLRLLAEPLAAEKGGGWEMVGRVLGARATATAFWNTLEAGLASTLLAVVVGGGLAIVVGLTTVRARGLLTFICLIPLLIPAQIAALAWLELAGPNSPLLRLIGLGVATGQRNPLYSAGGVIWLLGLEHAPMVFLAARAGLRALPNDLVEAARMAGAGGPRIVLTIILPLLRPALLAGAALAFVSAIGNFGVSALLGIPGRFPMLTTLIYRRLNGFGPDVLAEVAVLAMCLAGLAGAGLLLQAWAWGRQNRHAARDTAALAPLPLGRWRLAVEGGLWLFLGLTALMPLAALTGAALAPALGVATTWDTATLDHFRAVFANPVMLRALTNSFTLATVAGGVGFVVAAPLAYFIVTRRAPLARALNYIADMPYALPGIILSISCILLYLKPLPGLGISLYNSFWILLVAYLGRFLALSLRPAMAGVAQIDPALEEAARVAGAGPMARFFAIVLPLAAPAAAAGGLLVFLAAFNELTVSALLWSAGHETLGVMVFSLTDEGNSNAAAAVSVIAVLATLAVALAATVFARAARLPKGVLPWQD
ncbi:iron ABC transporter permease [Rhodospirillum rubrum]|uniref:ABC transporter permease n=1 Tax=Rhodospirillum rubrum TaxID=1085 RepID=UPI001902E037|nr:iron ABC transporter permease [Rhodospirillum rubrum]MBK1663426.1 iron ABC transporter permease [Rhodospirillum rubrum]MBK1675391.1 iron ABC transporter permease [Rhodospirillum rubrum]